MKFRTFLVSLAVLMLSSCSSGPSKPKPFLSERKMVKLLTELHLTEALLQQQQTQSYESFEVTRMYTHVAYTELFEKYGLTGETFEANLYYRTYHSRDLERIYTKVRDNLKQLDQANLEEPLAPDAIEK